MRLRKWVVAVLVLGLTLGSLPTAVGAQMNIASLILAPGGFQPHLEEVERIVFGQLQEGSLLDRLARLEQIFFGEQTEGILRQRIENLVRYIVVSTDQQPSLVVQLNAVEWAVYNATRPRPTILERIALIEREIYGMDFAKEPVKTRVDRLLQETWPGGLVRTERVEIPKGQLIHIALLANIDSSKAQVGDKVEYVVTRTVTIDNKIVIPAGARGTGTITSVGTSGLFGREGRVTIDWGRVQLIDGLEVVVELAEEESANVQSSQSTDRAILTALLGLALLGPPGIFAGALISGSDQQIPQGTQLVVQTVSDFTARGLSIAPMVESL